MNGVTNTAMALMSRNGQAPRKLPPRLIGKMPECLEVQDARERPRGAYVTLVYKDAASKSIYKASSASMLLVHEPMASNWDWL